MAMPDGTRYCCLDAGALGVGDRINPLYAGK